jgi:DNA-binding NarL/FixJ family response regulator
MYKILIADDHPLFREAIHNVISDGFPAARSWKPPTWTAPWR